MSTFVRTMPFSALSRQIDQIFGDLAGGRSFEPASFVPPVNVREDEKNFYVEAEVPGFAQEQIDVSLHQNVLAIKGEYAAEPTGATEGGGFIRRERTSGSFSRSFRLVSDIDGTKIAAALKNGVLHLTLPKAAAAQSRKIAVTGN
ncbi:MAG: Hsp20/alpha crystallin family protein [Phycisphaerales bacterium]